MICWRRFFSSFFVILSVKHTKWTRLPSGETSLFQYTLLFCGRCCCCLLASFLFISIFNHSHLAAWKMIYTPISVNYTLSVPIFHIHKYSHNSFQWLAEPKIVSLFLFLSSSLTTHESKYYNTKYIHFNMYFECYCCYYYNFNFINCVWCMYLPSFFSLVLLFLLLLLLKLLCVCVCGCSTHISLPSGGWVPVYVSIFHDFSCAEKRFYYFYVLSLNIFLLRVRIIYGHIQCSVARCSFSAFFAVIRVREKESEIEFGFSPFHYTVKYRPISYNKCMRMLNNNCP